MATELRPGVYGHLFEAPVCWGIGGAPLDSPVVGHVALLSSDLRAHAERGHSTVIAQFYGLFENGLMDTKHVFQGLQRPLRTDGNNSADAEKFVFVRKPAFD